MSKSFQDHRARGWQHISEPINNLVTEVRFQRMTEKVCALGPRVVGELLAEIGEQRACRIFIDQRLEAYAALGPEILRELGGDQFPRPPLHRTPR